MRKKISLFLILIISLFMFSGSVEAANNMAMWLNCDYNVYEEDVNKLETGRPIVFVGGWQSNTKTAGFYRLLNPKTFQEHSPSVSTWMDSDNPRFDGCWFYSEEDISKSCNDDSVKKYTESEVQQMLRDGVCPAIIRDGDGIYSNEVIVFAGQGNGVAYRLTNQYRFYKNDGDIYAYGYDINGFFIQTTNGNVNSSYNEEQRNVLEKHIISTSGLGIEKYGENFMNVGELDYATTIIPKNSEIVFDSNDNINKLYDAVDVWYSNYGSSLDDKSIKMEKIESDYSQLINSCSALNDSYDDGKKYNFNSSYTANSMLSDLNLLYFELFTFYNTENQFDLCVSDSTTTNASYSAYNCSMIELLGSIDYIPKQLQQFVLSDVNEYLTDVKGAYLDNASAGDNILNTVVKCSSYLKRNYDDFDLDSSEVSEISGKYEELGKSKGISIIYDCESLLGEDLIAKINSYLDIFKIAIPIILIVFGIIDFTKAIFTGDDEMKKARKNFIKRVVISILIFLTPTIVNFILSIANEVWSYISPNSCGLF